MSVESSIKLLDYINKVAKEPIYVDGVLFGHNCPSSVRLSESFFWEDSCVMCGRCCINETTVWTQEGINRIFNSTDYDFVEKELDPTVVKRVLDLIDKKIININGSDVTFYICPRDSLSKAYRLSWPDRKEQPRCHWLFEKDGTYRCSIHPIRPVTCGLPHCRFFYNAKTNKTSIGVSQYGRNWALKCPIEFNKEVSEESIKNRIVWLNKLKDVSDDLGISTFLPDIIDYLERGNRKPAEFGNITKHKLF